MAGPGTAVRVASPVDFDTYGDYAPPRPKTGEAFVRPTYQFQGRISADGSTPYPAEPGRYHLYISYACPWACRSAIVRELVGIQDAVSMSVVDPIRDGRGWAFREGAGYTPDPVNHFEFIKEAYEATEPGYEGHTSVPLLWDRKTSKIVSNNFPDISIDLGSEFRKWAKQPSVDLYPDDLRPQIDELNGLIYDTVNNGVYKCGFARTQQSYEAAFAPLFDTLDRLETRLARRRYLLGGHITEADWRLFTTLVRFDAVYYSHFKCNLRRIIDYSNLWGYTRDLYQVRGVAETVSLAHIKRHYYASHAMINPTRIVPVGPALDFSASHDRARLGD